MKWYNIYPTLLNDFAYYLNETGAEESGTPWVDEQGLIDRINRVRRTSPAMSKGTLFEQAVAHADTSELETLEGNYILQSPELETPLLVSRQVLDEAIRRYRGGVWQWFIETKLRIGSTRVRLYGYVDVIRRNIATDIKTSSSIKFHNFRDSYQHSAYLTALRDSGADIDHFDYFKTDFNDYDIERVNYSESLRGELTEHVARFIDFLESRREFITDKRIITDDSIG